MATHFITQPTYTEDENPYVLRVGDQGAENLNIQHQILEERSMEQLHKAGLQEGSIVWDIGCGSGAMTECIAKVVGPKGHVYAMDISEEQINTTKIHLTNAGYQNVSYMVGDIDACDTSDLDKADIVHCRFLLMHVKNPADVLRRMANLLKPGGVLCVQESSMNSLVDTCGNEAVGQFHQLLIKYGQQRGNDYNIGRKIPDLCSGLGCFSKIDFYETKLDATQKIAQNLIVSRVEEVRSRLVEAGVASNAEIDDIKNDMIKSFQKPAFDGCELYTAQTHVLASL